METQENPSSNNLSKPHPDSGDLVTSILGVATFSVIGVTFVGLIANALIANGQTMDEEPEVSDLDHTARVQLCIDEVSRITETTTKPRITIKVNEVLPDDGHHMVFLVDRTFETNTSRIFLNCIVDQKGAVTMKEISTEKFEELSKDSTTPVLDGGDGVINDDGTESVVVLKPVDDSSTSSAAESSEDKIPPVMSEDSGIKWGEMGNFAFPDNEE